MSYPPLADIFADVAGPGLTFSTRPASTWHKTTCLQRACVCGRRALLSACACAPQHECAHASVCVRLSVCVRAHRCVRARASVLHHRPATVTRAWSGSAAAGNYANGRISYGRGSVLHARLVWLGVSFRNERGRASAAAQSDGCANSCVLRRPLKRMRMAQCRLSARIERTHARTHARARTHMQTHTRRLTLWQQ